MILDLSTLLSNAQAITADAASTHILDLGAMGLTGYGKIQLKRNLGPARVPFLLMVNETFNNLTSLKVTIQCSADAAFTTPIEVASHTALLADLKKGYIFPIDKLPRGIKARYLRVHYDVTGTAPSTGKMTAGVVLAVDHAYVG